MQFSLFVNFKAFLDLGAKYYITLVVRVLEYS